MFYREKYFRIAVEIIFEEVIKYFIKRRLDIAKLINSLSLFKNN